MGSSLGGGGSATCILSLGVILLTDTSSSLLRVGLKPLCQLLQVLCLCPCTVLVVTTPRTLPFLKTGQGIVMTMGHIFMQVQHLAQSTAMWIWVR